jgi:hypothetical protein
MKLLGRLLFYEFGTTDGTLTSDPLIRFACLVIAEWLVEGRISVRGSKANRAQHLAFSVYMLRAKGEKWTAAVATVMEKYRVKRTTVTNACKKYRLHLIKVLRAKGVSRSMLPPWRRLPSGW